MKCDNCKDRCDTCKGRGLVRLHWKGRDYYERYYTDMYQDEWCKRCDGKGILQEKS